MATWTWNPLAANETERAFLAQQAASHAFPAGLHTIDVTCDDESGGDA